MQYHILQQQEMKKRRLVYIMHMIKQGRQDHVAILWSPLLLYDLV